MRMIVVCSMLILGLAGCQKSVVAEQEKINFEQVQSYAKRAAAAYQNEAKIRSLYPNTIYVGHTSGDVQFFVESDAKKNQQFITVRGTANILNAEEDAEYIESRNEKLGIYVHDGFDKVAMQVYQKLLPNLDQEKTLLITGHSLGAAVATLLMMYLHEDGYTLGRSINFGQPKLTNKVGAERYQFLPLLRVINENDVVPLVPADDLLDAIHGGYEHFGREIILLEGRYYVYEDKKSARQKSFASLWRNLGEASVKAHYMQHYLLNLHSKIKTSQQVSFSERERYFETYN